MSFLQRVLLRHSAASLARSVWGGGRLDELRSVTRGSVRTADGGGWGMVSAARTRASLTERGTPSGSDGIPDLDGASADVGHETPSASPQSPAGATVAHANGSGGASKKTLVVVESPAKARTIQKFLPPQYAVDACMGHIRDLPGAAEQIPPQYKSQPWARLGIHIEDDFRPLYVVPATKKAVVERLRQRLAACSGLILATDEDREGEAISWHLVELLQPQVPVRRAVFHEITEDAVREAFANCRDIDMNLVKAQEARRILDRLAGFTMSPLLWKKISRGLSAGRVQSVALAMIVECELARLRFKPATFWGVQAVLALPSADGAPPMQLDTVLHSVRGARIATGRDFDDLTGQLKRQNTDKVLWLDEDKAQSLVSLVQSLPPNAFQVVSVERRTSTRPAPPPFITSTLQQEASRRLRLSAAEVMRVAQRLYENGHITYMRTDSPVLSAQAVQATRQAVTGAFGRDHLAPEGGRARKKPKRSQEAHEAIRPTGKSFVPPERSGLTAVERRLYEMVYYRTLASEMAPAKVNVTNLVMEGPGELQLRARGRETVFAGWLRALGVDTAAGGTEGGKGTRAMGAGTADADAENGDGDAAGTLPLGVVVREGDRLSAVSAAAESHQTQPPSRFTEAALVKEMESNGVGRPSTYAPTIEMLVERAYVRRAAGSSSSGATLVPTLTAFAVVRLLQRHFPDFVNVSFTSAMEEALDRIARGEGDRTTYLSEYYSGEHGLAATVAAKDSSIDPQEVRQVHLPALEAGGASESVKVFVGPYGPYVSNGKLASLPKLISPDEVTPERVQRLLALQAADGVLGDDPQSGRPVLLKFGRYGPYVELGGEASVGGADGGDVPAEADMAEEADGSARADIQTRTRVSVPKGMDVTRVDLELALRLLSLPRVVGTHPETDEPIVAGYSRWGSYLQYRGAYTRLRDAPGGNLRALDIEVDEAVQLLAERKVGEATGDGAKSTQSAASSRRSAVMRSLGAYRGVPMEVCRGRYGPFIRYGTTNVRIPRPLDPQALTYDEAARLVAEKVDAVVLTADEPA